eukprot:TRINITY_DN25666_c0_g1_i1.p1 TRINITY_DN25666_c0_g1~~TRINITY_DN25666_c0_g1_i1.p1  ORF type:complete len:122 (+),score=15.26 TRINITY_DN25666_c0_g1_i1:105-470(+)
MPATLYRHCQVQMGTSVYVMGGYGSSGWSASVFVLEDSVWREASPMVTPRSFHACTAHEGKIYAIGGNDGSSILSSVEIYDPLTDSWDRGPELPLTLFNAQVINHQGNIYVLGGRGGQWNE